MSAFAPSGFNLSQRRSTVNEYCILVDDTTSFSVGDPVTLTGTLFVGKLPDGRPTQGMPAVRRAYPGDSVRGVLSGVMPAPGGAEGLVIPAVKTRVYTVLVADNPGNLYEVQANNTRQLTSVNGLYASFMYANPAGSSSGVYIDVDTLNPYSGDVLIHSVVENKSSYSRFLVSFCGGAEKLGGLSGGQVRALVADGGFAASATGRMVRSLLGRALAKGCQTVPNGLIYIDPQNGNDAADGSLATPKRTAMHSGTTAPLWSGAKTAFFSDEMLVFKGGTAYTHPEANGRITVTSRKHVGAYYTEMNQARPIINGTIYASGDLQDIIIEELDIRPSFPNQPSIFFQQTAAAQAIRRLTVRGNALRGGTINDATARGALQVQYFNTFTTTNPYLPCTDILIDSNLFSAAPGHGVLLGGAVGVPAGQINGEATLIADSNPGNTETITIAGIVFTAVTVIGATAGNFLIGASSNATLINLAGLINSPSTTSATQVALAAGDIAVASALGLRATVVANTLVLTLTAFQSTAFLSETLAAGRWDRTFVETTQIWGGVDAINNVVEDCGAQMDCHAVSSYSAGVLLNKTALTFTNTSGTIYYTDVSVAALYNVSVPSIDAVSYDTGSGTEIFNLIPNYGRPTVPAPGEFGFDVTTQRLYMNGNIVLNAATRINIATRSAKGIRWINTKIRRQKFNNILGGSALEGHAIAFDDYTSYSAAINTEVIDCAGHAVTYNRGNNNIVVGLYAKDFDLAFAKCNFGFRNVLAKAVGIYSAGAIGFSDTVPGFKGVVHMAQASTRLGVTTNDRTSWAGNIISHVDIVWNGSSTGVVGLLGPTSSNAPPLTANNVDMHSTNSGFTPSGGRVLMSNRQPELIEATMPGDVYYAI